MITKIVSLVIIAVLRSEYPVRHNHTQLSVPNLELRVCRKKFYELFKVCIHNIFCILKLQ